jgi:hypothetical protein
MNKLNFLFTAFILMILVSCSKYNTNINELPTWNSEWLLPLVKGKLSFENIKELSNAKTSFDVPSIDIGYASGLQVNVPPINLPEVGPYKQPLSNWIHQVQFDSLEIDLSFTNVFPIAVGAGTKFSFRRTPTTADPNNIIYQHTITNDIAPNQSYTFNVDVINYAVSDTLYLYLEQFNSPGGNNVTFTSNPSKINIEVQIIDIKKVELYPDKSVVEQDTVEIDFGDEDTNTGGLDTSSNGTVNFFIDNALPINCYTQVYFLDPVSSVIKDSLLSTPLNIVGCNTDANGDPTNVKSSKTSFFISSQRIDQIKKSTKAIIVFKLNTNGYPPPYVLMSDQTYLKLQITGDLKLSFNLNSL